jgi:pilus assembly protein Flp/PilA
MKELLRRFVREEEGQDLIEYALLAALIGVVTVAAMNALQNAIEGQFNSVETQLGGGS